MLNKLVKLKKDIMDDSVTEGLVCFIVFGSQLIKHNTGVPPGDVDICIVVKNRDVDLIRISKYIYTHFDKPDFRIYIEDEVESNLNFVDVGNGLFAIEYYATGFSIYGKNIFIEMLENVDFEKIRQSYLSKIFEYILRIRVAYVTDSLGDEYRLWHLNKYVLRMSIDILLYYNYIKYADLENLSKDDIYNLCDRYGFIKGFTEINYKDVSNLYALFLLISEHFVFLHRRLN